MRQARGQSQHAGREAGRQAVRQGGTATDHTNTPLTFAAPPALSKAERPPQRPNWFLPSSIISMGVREGGEVVMVMMRAGVWGREGRRGNGKEGRRKSWEGDE